MATKSSERSMVADGRVVERDGAQVAISRGLTPCAFVAATGELPNAY